MDELIDLSDAAGDLAPEDAERLRAALERDPAFREAVAKRLAVGRAIGGALEEDIPDRRLLVYHALDRSGRAALLSAEERGRLDTAHEAVEGALARHESLRDVTALIERDCELFESVWPSATPAPAQGRRRPRPDRQPFNRPVSRTKIAWRAAAAMAVLSFLVVVGLLWRRDASFETFATDIGQQRLVELADGSRIHLMEGSVLRLPNTSGLDGRRARLDGKAYFEVAPGVNGFTVETQTALTTVLGTDFSVDAGEALTEVILASGRVAISPEGAPDRIVVLEPGQMSRVAARAMPTTPVSVDLTMALDWTGLFIFRDSRMDSVATQLSSFYGASVEVAPALAEERVNGTFEQSQPLPEILRSLALTLGATVVENPGGGYNVVR